MTIDRTFAYVPHDRIDLMLAHGWRVADDFAGCHHGYFSVLMERVDIVEPAESLGDVALRVIEDLARRTGRAE